MGREVSLLNKPRTRKGRSPKTPTSGVAIMRIRQRLDKLEQRRLRRPVDAMKAHDQFFREIHELAWAIHRGVKPPEMSAEEWDEIMWERERFRRYCDERHEPKRGDSFEIAHDDVSLT